MEHNATTPTKLTLNSLFAQLKHAEKLEIFPSALSYAKRLERLQYFLPDSFIQELHGRSTSYLSWLLNDNRKTAKSLFALYHTLFRQNSEAILQETKALADVYFADLTIEQEMALQDILKPFLTQREEFLRYQNHSNRFAFYIETDPVRAFSILVIFLCIGAHASEDIDLLFPEFESFHFDASMNTIQKQFAFAQLCYENGDHAKAFRLFQELAQEKGDKESIYRVGKMLLLGDGCADVENREEQGFHMLRTNRDHAKSVYETHLCLLNGIGTNKIYRRAKDCLENASRMNVLAAHRDLGMAYYTGHEQMRYEKDEEKAYELFQKGACTDAPEQGDATCQYMLGLFEEQKNGYVNEIALNWYRHAAKNGSIRAKQRLLDYSSADKRKTVSALSGQTHSPASGDTKIHPETLLLFFNSYSRQTFDFIRTLPDNKHYQMIFSLPLTDCEKIPYIKQTIEQIFLAEKKDSSIVLPEIIYYPGHIDVAVSSLLSTDRLNTLITEQTEVFFYLFHDVQKQNLLDSISILETFKPLQKQSPVYAEYFAKHIQVYLLSELANTDALIDSAISSMKDTYIKVQVCHPGMDAGKQLFYRKPLFLPCIGKNKAKDINLIVIGDHHCIPGFLQNALSILYKESGRQFHITVFSKEDSEVTTAEQQTEPSLSQIEMQFRHLCPGMFHHPKLVDAHLSFFSFHQIDKLWDLLSQPKNTFSDSDYNAACQLEQGNYFIVAFEDMLHTIDVSTQLRANLLKYDPTFTRIPFIAAYCPDDILACQTEKLIVGNMAYGLDWFNNYDIYCFGSYTELYSYYNLTHDLLRIRALQLHLSYCKNLNDPIAVSNAYQAYYGCSYNRDSSETDVLNLTYRVFAAGITLPDPASYGIPQEELHLAPQYGLWLSEPSHLNQAVKQEHARWTQFMLTRGFEPATLTQMITYLHRGNPTQLLQIAKLHPFICTWDDLVDDQDGVQFHLNQIMKTLRPDMEPMNIRNINTKFITDTAWLLSILDSET